MMLRFADNRTPYRIYSEAAIIVHFSLSQRRPISLVHYLSYDTRIIVDQRYSKKIVTPARKEDLTFRLRHFDPLDLRLAAWNPKQTSFFKRAVDIRKVLQA